MVKKVKKLSACSPSTVTRTQKEVLGIVSCFVVALSVLALALLCLPQFLEVTGFVIRVQYPSEWREVRCPGLILPPNSSLNWFLPPGEIGRRHDLPSIGSPFDFVDGSRLVSISGCDFVVPSSLNPNTPWPTRVSRSFKTSSAPRDVFRFLSINNNVLPGVQLVNLLHPWEEMNWLTLTDIPLHFALCSSGNSTTFFSLSHALEPNSQLTLSFDIMNATQ